MSTVASITHVQTPAFDSSLTEVPATASQLPGADDLPPRIQDRLAQLAYVRSLKTVHANWDDERRNICTMRGRVAVLCPGLR